MRRDDANRAGGNTCNDASAFSTCNDASAFSTCNDASAFSTCNEGNGLHAVIPAHAGTQ